MHLHPPQILGLPNIQQSILNLTTISILIMQWFKFDPDPPSLLGKYITRICITNSPSKRFLASRIPTLDVLTSRGMSRFLLQKWLSCSSCLLFVVIWWYYITLWQFYVQFGSLAPHRLISILLSNVNSLFLLPFSNLCRVVSRDVGYLYVALCVLDLPLPLCGMGYRWVEYSLYKRPQPAARPPRSCTMSSR